MLPLLTFLISLSTGLNTNDTLQLSLTIGDYYDDHYYRKSSYEERTWQIKGDTLYYQIVISARDEIYKDQQLLSLEQKAYLKEVIKDHYLNKDILINHQDPHLSKKAYQKQVKGSLYWQGNHYTYQVKGNSKGVEENPFYRKINALEQALYKLVE